MRRARGVAQYDPPLSSPLPFPLLGFFLPLLAFPIPLPPPATSSLAPLLGSFSPLHLYTYRLPSRSTAKDPPVKQLVL